MDRINISTTRAGAEVIIQTLFILRYHLQDRRLQGGRKKYLNAIQDIISQVADQKGISINELEAECDMSRFTEILQQAGLFSGYAIEFFQDEEDETDTQ